MRTGGDGFGGTEREVHLSGETEGSLIRCIWIRRVMEGKVKKDGQRKSAIEECKERNELCCCGKGHRPPL